MKQFTLADIQSWDRFYRAHFINSLSGFKSATLIGTVNKIGRTNLAIFSNIVHVGADPPMIGFINRPKEAAPHTINNIESTGVYTMNHVHASFIEKAHQTSAKYDDDKSEFDEVGLTAEWKNTITAPFVLESTIKYAMRLDDIIHIKQNGTFLVIGAVQDVFFDDTILAENGYLNIEKCNSITTLGIDAYYDTKLLARFSYAKPYKNIEKIK